MSARADVKILWLNPIGYESYDQPMADFVSGIKQENTNVEVSSFSSDFKMDNLEYRTYEALIAADVIRVVRHAAQNDFDAMVVGCFYDPHLEDAREISGDTIVVAPCQASLQIAANLCNKFSVIIGQEKWRQQMAERVYAYGYGSRLASMRSIDMPVCDLQKDCGLTASRIIEAGRKAVEEDQAEALILGCTCTFGLHEEVQRELGVPVIDPIIAAFKMAEYLGHLKRIFGWTPSRLWSCAPPPEAQLEAFGLFTAPAPIGNTVTV